MHAQPSNCTRRVLHRSLHHSSNKFDPQCRSMHWPVAYMRCGAFISRNKDGSMIKLLHLRRTHSSMMVRRPLDIEGASKWLHQRTLARIRMRQPSRILHPDRELHRWSVLQPRHPMSVEAVVIVHQPLHHSSPQLSSHEAMHIIHSWFPSRRWCWSVVTIG